MSARLQLTAKQLNCLREIERDGLPSGSTKTINSLHYAHHLIERATLGKPHPTNTFAWWRLTEAGRLELESR